MGNPFYRSGQPVRVPVSPTSGSAPFDMTGKMPVDVMNRRFMVVNPCPFDIRLEGTPEGGSFIAVTGSTGLLVMARTKEGPYTSKNPVLLSVQAFATPGMPLPVGFDYTGCFIEFIYGRGD